MKASVGKYALLSLVVGVLALAWYLSPEEIPPETWHENDQRAFGGHILQEFLEDYSGATVQSVYEPINEYFAFADSTPANVLVVCNEANFSREDWYSLESMLEAGSTVIIAAKEAPYFLEFYLQADPSYFSFSGAFEELFVEAKTMRFAKDLPYPQAEFSIPLQASARYYVPTSGPRDSSLIPQVLAYNEDDDPVLLRHQIGNGELILSCMPSLFNNYFLLDSTSRSFSQGILSFLEPDLPVYNFEFYHLGRLESRSPLRVALKEPALKVAVYLLAILVLLYIVLGGKRRQKAIPEKQVWQNDNLDFLEQLSFLYHKNGHHRNLLKKRMQYFQNFIEQNYRIRLRADRDGAFEEIIRKLEPAPEVIGPIRLAHQKLADQTNISPQDLLTAEKALQEFYHTYRHGRKH